MNLASFSLDRPVTEYRTFRRLVSVWKRNRRSQLRSSRVRGKDYLDVGCGPNTHGRFINLEYLWHPGVDLCWDVARGLPLRDGCIKGLFSEHCLEHFSLATGRFLLQEFHRVMSPGGTVRIVVPDAGLYLDLYARRKAGQPTDPFPYEERDHAGGLASPIVSVNRIFYIDRDSPAGHCYMYDYALLAEMLAAVGFRNIRREQYGNGSDPALLIDSEHRRVESMYVEAQR